MVVPKKIRLVFFTSLLYMEKKKIQSFFSILYFQVFFIFFAGAQPLHSSSHFIPLDFRNSSISPILTSAADAAGQGLMSQSLRCARRQGSHFAEGGSRWHCMRRRMQRSHPGVSSSSRRLVCPAGRTATLTVANSGPA